MTSDQKSRINYNNLTYLGYDLNEIYTKASKEYSRLITEKYPVANNIVMICGTEGNGLDGLYIAECLATENRDCSISIYVPGRVNQSDSDLFKTKYKDLSKFPNIKLFQDIYAKDVPQGDLILEALCGTGFEGESLYKRSADLVRRVVHFSVPMIAIDKAVPGYKPELTVSLNFPKSKDAVVIDNVYPESLNSVIGPGELLEIKKPYLRTHKSKSGKLLVITQANASELIDRILSLSKAYPAEIEVLSIQEIFANYVSNSYKDRVSEADVILIDKFEDGDELLTTVVSKILEAADDTPVINLSNKLKLNHIHLEMVLSPKELSNSNASIRIVKGFSSSILFNDGQKKIDTSGMLLTEGSIDDLMCLSAIYATANELPLSVIAAAFTVIHFRKNKLDLEKDLTPFFEEIF
jgi:NAD(P)H-hydrate repair Nnr-like enzyme with NAD(P)H-hydrate epimerase domain